MQEDVVIGGLRFSGLRIFIFTTWLAVLAALLVVLFCVRDYTVIDPEVCTTGAASPFVKAKERTGLHGELIMIFATHTGSRAGWRHSTA